MNELQRIKVLNVTPPAAIIDNAAVTTAEIDTAGYDYLTVFHILGATDIVMTTPLELTESDTSGSGHTAIAGTDHDGDTDIFGDTAALPSATDDDSVFVTQVNLRGRKRYIDVSATVGNGTAGTFITILAVLSMAGQGATTLAEHGDVAGFLRV